jgi:lipoprotein-anchoring transpeptidase ErfK/SrfK
MTSPNGPPVLTSNRPAPERRRAPSRLRVAVVGLCAVVPLVPIVVGIVLLGGAATKPAPGSRIRSVTRFPPAGVPSLSRGAPRRLSIPTASQIAIVTHPTEIRSSPNGPVISAQPTSTSFGSPVSYLVRRVDGHWLGVVSPLAGNHRLGWIPSSAVLLSSVNWKIEVSLDARRLEVLRGAKVVERFRIAIGKPSAPTPTGYFAVTDRLSTGDPLGPYGCCILALSAQAPHAIQGWGGGTRIAIHSTPPDTYWSIGAAVSHGCMHVTLPEGRWLLDHIPDGTPAIIRSD